MTFRWHGRSTWSAVQVTRVPDSAVSAGSEDSGAARHPGPCRGDPDKPRGIRVEVPRQIFRDREAQAVEAHAVSEITAIMRLMMNCAGSFGLLKNLELLRG